MTHPSCDLLSKFISLAFWYNKYIWGVNEIIVVICFQNLYLWLSDTTVMYNVRKSYKLWFAFKIYIFGFLIQPWKTSARQKSSCDLLSKFISLAFWYNMLINIGKLTELWFAFKIYIFGFLIQLEFINYAREDSCDLLSKFISLAFWYNY